MDNDCDGDVDDDDVDVPDADGDGVPACTDCDEGDPSVYPGAPEACGGVDNDCDGLVNDFTSILTAVDAAGDTVDPDAPGTAVSCTGDVNVADVEACFDSVAGVVLFRLYSHSAVATVDQELVARIDLDGVGEWRDADYAINSFNTDTLDWDGMLYSMDPVYWSPVQDADPFEYVVGSDVIEMGFEHASIGSPAEIWVGFDVWCNDYGGVDFAPDPAPDTVWAHVPLD